MSQDSPTATASHVVTIFSGIGSVLTFVFSLPLVISLGLATVTVGGLCIIVYKKIKPVSFISLFGILSKPINYDSVSPDNFETIHNFVKIQIADNCRDAFLFQKRLVKCKQHNVNKYFYRFASGDRFLEFSHTPGDIVSSKIKGGGKDIIVQFDRPCKIGQTFNLEISCKGINLFNSLNEYWCIHKYYAGNEIYNIEVCFPEKFPPKRFDSEIIINDDFNNGKPCSNTIELTVIDGKPTLVLEEKNLQIGQKIYINWQWKKLPETLD